MEKVAEILDIKIRVKTDKDEEKIICLTDFCKSQSVNITCDNNDFILSVKNVNAIKY